ncbi:MAG: hypothetical protein AAF907_08375, partial [Planctomycetota bacterium]
LAVSRASLRKRLRRRVPMSLVNVSLKHDSTLEEAKRQLAQTVAEIAAKFGGFIHQTEWSEDRRAVRLHGPGMWVSMKVDAEFVHAEGDIPALRGLLGRGMKGVLEGALRKSFPKALPPN